MSIKGNSRVAMVIEEGLQGIAWSRASYEDVVSSIASGRGVHGCSKAPIPAGPGSAIYIKFVEFAVGPRHCDVEAVGFFQDRGAVGSFAIADVVRIIPTSPFARFAH